jgi:hypothetical protein
MNSNFPSSFANTPSFSTAFSAPLGQSDPSRELIGNFDPFTAPPPGAPVFEQYPFGGVPGATIEAEAGAETALVPLEIEGLGTLSLEAVAGETLLALGPVGGVVLVGGLLTYGLYRIYTSMRESAQQSGSTSFTQVEQDRMYGFIGQVNEAENEIRSLLAQGRPSNPDEAAAWDRKIAVAVDTLGAATGELLAIIRGNPEHVSPFIAERVEEIHTDFMDTLDFRPGGVGTPTIDQIMVAVSMEGRVKEDLLSQGFPATVNVLPSIGSNGELVFSADVHLGSNDITSLVANSVAIIAAGSMNEMASDLGVGPYIIDPSITVTDHDGASVEVPLLVGSPDSPETSSPTTSNLSHTAQTILLNLNDPDSGVYKVDTSQFATNGTVEVTFNNGDFGPRGGSEAPGYITGSVTVQFPRGGGEPVFSYRVGVVYSLPGENGLDGLRGGDLLQAVFPAAMAALVNTMTGDTARFSPQMIAAVSNFASGSTPPNSFELGDVINPQTLETVMRFRGALLGLTSELIRNGGSLTFETFLSAYNNYVLPEVPDGGHLAVYAEQTAEIQDAMDQDGVWSEYVNVLGPELAEQLYYANFDSSAYTENPSSSAAQIIDFFRQELVSTPGSVSRMAAAYMLREFGVNVTGFSLDSIRDLTFKFG